MSKKLMMDLMDATIEAKGLGPIVTEIFEIFARHDLSIDRAGLAAECVLMRIQNLPAFTERQKAVMEKMNELHAMLTENWGKVAPDTGAILKSIGLDDGKETE